MLLRKILTLYHRILNILFELPFRLKRLFVHFLWFGKRRNEIPQLIIVDSFWEWLVFIPFYIIDVFGIPDIYQILLDIVFYKSRSLTDTELDSSYRLFRNSIRYEHIKINENERWVAKRLNIAYVSFETVHTSRAINSALLIHELVHVWQYTQFGSVYIYKALLAQKSKLGYNYQGRDGLASASDNRKQLYQFNFEQQGDIISDYYKLSSGIRPNWIENNSGSLIVFRPFVSDLLKLRRFKPPKFQIIEKAETRKDGMA